SKICFSTILGAIILPSALLVLVFSLTSQRLRTRVVAAWCITTSGFTLMTLQILLLLAFQSVFGYVYRELALLIGMMMAGIAAGSLLGLRHIRRRHETHLRYAAVNQSFIAIAAPLLLAIVYLLAETSNGAASLWIVQAVFPLIALLCGLPGGYQYSLATAIYLKDRSRASSLSTLYAVDLLGGCVGALLIAGFLIPVFGFWSVAWLAAAVSAAPAILAARAGFYPAD
ncbi:MAG: hypothetical protein WCA37_09175, partial [Terracidiphilus sp.]